MRWLSFLNLLLFLLLSLHGLNLGPGQVLCIEKDGRTSIETVQLAQRPATDRQTPLLRCGTGQHCPDCQDIFLGSQRAESLRLQPAFVFDAGVLQLVRPALVSLPARRPAVPLPAAEPVPLAPPAHLASTVLLI